MSRFPLLLFVLAAGALTSCKRAPDTVAKPGEAPPANAKSGAPVKAPTAPVPEKIWEQFSGERAFTEVRKQVEIGPRPAGTAEIEKARVLIEESLRISGWQSERQKFSDQTPRGPVEFVNIVARFSASGARPVPTNTQRALICSHYDTKRFSTIRFIGANDGGSSTGALLELARVLALDPVMAEKIELVFFDGEEAFVQFDETDGLYGSRHYASQLRSIGRHSQFKFGILWDMIGDRDLTITLPPDSPADLARDLLASADALALRSHFGYLDRPIQDDHVPLNRIARIPTIDLIDFDYLAWHTADDTLERISPESLQKIGAVTLHHLRKTLAR